VIVAMRQSSVFRVFTSLFFKSTLLAVSSDNTGIIQGGFALKMPLWADLLGM